MSTAWSNDERLIDHIKNHLGWFALRQNEECTDCDVKDRKAIRDEMEDKFARVIIGHVVEWVLPVEHTMLDEIYGKAWDNVTASGDGIDWDEFKCAVSEIHKTLRKEDMTIPAFTTDGVRRTTTGKKSL